MALKSFLLCALFLASRSYGMPAALEKQNSSDILCACDEIAAAISSDSQVFFPASSEYLLDISHSSPSVSEASVCSVEPGSAEDVSKIIRILGSKRTPFAVKGGGHAVNPGFSSTTGVQIAMTRFNETKVNSTCGTVEVGAGLTWDEVYDALNHTGVTVVGGREPGVGVAGLTLGGGYSYKSSQYGLTVDNIAGYELVLPNGTVVYVTSKDRDLWFGLRGGMNNFGIVTKFTLVSHPQGEVWGGTRSYNESQLGAIKNALVNFQQKKDTKAVASVVPNFYSGQFIIAILYFYDASAPSSIFDEFLAIPTIGGNLSTSSLSDFVRQVPNPFLGYRSLYNDAPVTQYSPAVFDAFVDQTKFWGPYLYAQDKNSTVTLNLEPFDEDYFSHGSDSAYPPDRSQALFPAFVTVQWSDPSLDDKMAFVVRNISDTIRAVALADGQNVSHVAKYPNYATYGTPLEEMYGGNVERLRNIRTLIDPGKVMDLTGGWRF
ncbi:FAD-binding domain-containing protein [Russula emetica]|nr:FAD-binding domain-containing protein [Russula emetica]